MTIEKLSASGIKKFRECPKQFWYRYLTDIEPPEVEEPEHFKVGNTVHEAIENVLTNDAPLDDKDELFSLLVKEEERLDYGHDSPDKVENCLDMAAKYITKYVVSIISVEDEWNMEYSKIDFKGYADLVANIEEDGELIENAIIDWKTGSEQAVWKEQVQGGVYVEMFHDEYHEWPGAVDFVYLDEGTKSRNKRIQDDGSVLWNNRKNEWWDEIEKTINKILHSDNVNEWEAKPESSKCHFCDYALACSDYVGSEEVTPVEIEFGL